MRSASLLLAVAMLAAAPARADLVFQSATPIVTSTTGDTGFSGTSVSPDFFSAADFHLDVSTKITAVGGHFGNFGAGNGEIFGAITAVSGPGAAPADPTLTTGVLASTLITLPALFATTDTLSGSLSVTLGPGDYAVVFGSGKFGATGAGGLIENVTSPTFNGPVNTDAVVTYTLRQSDGAQFLQAGNRLFVEGVAAVPEPSTYALATAASLLALGYRRARRRRAVSR